MKAYIHFKKLLCLSVASVLLWGTSQAPSIALPGQTLEETQNMVRSSETFSGMSLEYSDWMGESYGVSKGSGNKGTVLTIFETNGIVTSESLQYRYPNFSMAFERDNETGLRLIEAMWGGAVVEDFVNSRYTDAIEDPSFRQPYHFYLGDRYGYQVIYMPEHNGNSGIHTLRVTDHGMWEKSRQLARLCFNNPNHNDCQSY